MMIMLDHWWLDKTFNQSQGELVLQVKLRIQALINILIFYWATHSKFDSII